MRFLIDALVPALLLCALTGAQAVSPVPPALTHDQIELQLRGKLETQERAVFVSRSGKIYGMDSDSLISFERKGEVIMGEYGVAYQGYRGSYEVSPEGNITLKLKGFSSTWPPMKLVATATDLWLYPATGKGGLVMGGRGGATETGGMNSFWPFKLVKGRNKPGVTPIYTGGAVRRFVSPVLPDQFHWHEGVIEFRVDFDISEAGKIAVSKYFTFQTPTHVYAKDDWRLPVTECAIEAVKQCDCVPLMADEKPVRSGGMWDFIAGQVDGQTHWVVNDGNFTIFDNMPRATARKKEER